MGGLKWAIWASGGSYNSLSHPLQKLPLTLAMSDHDDDEEGDDLPHGGAVCSVGWRRPSCHC